MTEYEACENCGGWCCIKFPSVEFGYEARLRVARELGLSVGEVTNRFSKIGSFSYTDGKPDRVTRMLKYSQPCVFWSAGACGIHHIKPDACAVYDPVTVKDFDCQRCEHWQKRTEEKKCGLLFYTKDKQ